MKRTFLVLSLCMLASYSFAQKKAVKDAKSAMKSDINEARALIKPALTNPETMNDAEAWRLAGDIEHKSFDDQKTAETIKHITNKPANEEEMYNSLYDMCEPYLKAAELGELPDDKGKVKNKHVKDVIKLLKESYPYYVNGGIYFNEKKEHKRAADFFERYWNMPDYPIFSGDQTAFNKKDTIFQTIKYYAAISAIQSEDHPRAINFLKKMINEPYVQNSTYKESDLYELLTAEYQTTKDSVEFVNTLALGAQKFPKNSYFTPNLINEYIRAGKMDEALKFLDQAIANDPTNTCDLSSVKGSLYSEQKNYDEAEKAFKAALSQDLNCSRAQEGLGVLYVLLAQDMKEKAGQTANRKDQADLDKQTAEFYQKGLPYLEQYRDSLKAKKADLRDMRAILMKLQNVYYNLSLLKIEKNKELEAIDAELTEINKLIEAGN